jgi:hypothetical protein
MGHKRTKSFGLYVGTEVTSPAKVRINDDGDLVINDVPSAVWKPAEWEKSRAGYTPKAGGTTVKADWIESVRQQGIFMWVRCVDGWEQDGNWGGYLQFSGDAYKGKWVDSSDGWAKLVGSKADPISFYDMGDYYEVWQKRRENGKPLTVVGNKLRFVKNGEPAAFNIIDATWT